MFKLASDITKLQEEKLEMEKIHQERAVNLMEMEDKFKIYMNKYTELKKQKEEWKI